MADSSPSMVLQKILTQATTQRAVSIHLSCGSPPALRARGELSFLETFGVVSPDVMNRLIIELLSPEELEIFTHKKNISVAKNLSREHRYRVHVFYQKQLPALSLYSLPVRVKPLSELRVPRSTKVVLQLDKGLVVVSGPCGSGKTTLLFGILEECNQKFHKRILTIEKPIEYLLENRESLVQQMEVGKDVDSFREALVAARDEDYDIVYISDIQSEPVLPEVFELISSGKLVLLELSSLSSVNALQDILSLAVRHGVNHAASACADAVEVVFNLRLLPGISMDEVMATEVLIMLPEVKALLRDERLLPIEGIIQTNRRQGLETLDQSIADLVNDGFVSSEVALQYARDQNFLKGLIKE